MVQVYFQCSHCSEKKLVMSTNAFDLDDGLDLEELVNDSEFIIADHGDYCSEDCYNTAVMFEEGEF